jgi:hypothetical protein
MVRSIKKKARDRTNVLQPANATDPAPIIVATLEYERWLHKRIDVVEPDLQLKYEKMAGSLFVFLRGTFYRWGPLWLEVCPEFVKAPQVLAVGDLHVGNFGTWRDAEGRLIWGVNDFDEAAQMPYAVDLIRLVTSAILAKREKGLAIDDSVAATAVLEGYAESLEAGGDPFILEESHPGLREMAMGAEREPTRFWSKLIKLTRVTPPKPIQQLLQRSLPDKSEEIEFSHRIAGVGSLGRPRYLATARCNGGLVAREAKAWLPSAWGWAKGRPKERDYSVRLLKRAVQQPDPYYAVEDGWVVRRLGPHCGKIKLAQLPKQRDQRLILKVMGSETANLHLGTSDKRTEVLRDLTSRKSDWLLKAAEAMSQATEQDWKSFRSSLFVKVATSMEPSSSFTGE